MNTNQAPRPHRYNSPLEIDAKLSELQIEAARLEAELARVRAGIAARNDEFNARGGWTRAFIVTDGHVHSSQACTTCYATTEMFWLPELSDHDEAEIVDLAGERACTVCYPTAPVDALRKASRLFTADERTRAEERAARQVEKDERRAKAAANAPTASGEPLVLTRDLTGGYSETFKTERAATLWATDLIATRSFYSREITDRDTACLEAIYASIAGKRGVEVATVRGEIEAKATAKIARDQKELAKHRAEIARYNAR